MRVNMDDGDIVDINMGPLIDCVFLLLIFFLVSTTMKKPEEEIAVELPEPAVSAMPNADKAPTVIAIDVDGIFYWDAVPIGQSEMRRRIHEIGTDNLEQHIRIDVDRNSASRYLVQVMDLCAFEGLKNYGIHTEGEMKTNKPKAPPAK